MVRRTRISPLGPCMLGFQWRRLEVRVRRYACFQSLDPVAFGRFVVNFSLMEPWMRDNRNRNQICGCMNIYLGFVGRIDMI